LRKLEVFYWVAELRSFSLAAEHLSLRQPTVSAHVHELEEQMGAKVLKRMGGAVTPTDLGRVLLERARTLLALKGEILAVVDSFKGGLRGELLIGGSNIPGEYILPAKLGTFVQRYPEIKPVLQIGDSATVVESVLEGRVELGFVGIRGEDARLSFQKMWKDQMVLAVQRGHPWTRMGMIDLKELNWGRFISRERGSGTLRSLRTLLARKGYDPEGLLNVTMELGSTAAIKEALVNGLGVSILSKTCIQREIRDGLLEAVPIRGLKLERNFYEVFHRHRVLSPVSQAFRSFLREK